jgi:WXG100 family type VII secretion target
MYISGKNGKDTTQIDPEALLSTAPQFQTASDAIKNAAKSLQNAMDNAASAWDGKAQKQLTSMGGDFVTNLLNLAAALETISTNLQTASDITTDCDTQQSHRFHGYIA